MEDGPRTSGITVWGAGTPRTLRVHWALHELGIDYQAHTIVPRSAGTQSTAYERLNASRKVPTLVDGGFVLTESGAIVNYLCHTYGDRAGMAPPTDGRERARYDEWCFFALMELDATSTYVIRRHADMPQIYGEAPAAVDAALKYCNRALQSAAVRLGDGPCVMGERFTGADIHLVTCLNSALHRGIALPQSLADYRQRLVARPAYQRAFTLNQPT